MRFEATARTEAVLKKLAKAQIPVGNVRAEGVKVRFSVNREYIRKVFAIFKHPCYNIVIRDKSVSMRFCDFLKRRLGVVIGIFVVFAAIVFSQTTVLRISVTGNAEYLTQRVLAVAAECGAKPFTSCSGLDKPLLAARVTSLDGVEFCSVSRKGWAIVIDVHVRSDSHGNASKSPLRAQKSGVIKSLTVLCGTAEKSVGDSVSVGEVIIGNYECLPNGETSECRAVGFAEIEVQGSVTLFYETTSAENERQALSAPSVYSESVIKKSLSITPCDGGFYYKVDFAYLYTQLRNMD